MRQEHLKRWRCSIRSHPPQTFNSSADYVTHLRACHPQSFDEKQIPFLVGRSARAQGPTFTECPLCGTTEPELKDGIDDHIVSHLRQLALMCLPWPDSDIVIDNTLTLSDNLESESGHTRTTIAGMSATEPQSPDTANAGYPMFQDDDTPIRLSHSMASQLEDDPRAWEWSFALASADDFDGGLGFQGSPEYFIDRTENLHGTYRASGSIHTPLGTSSHGRSTVGIMSAAPRASSLVGNFSTPNEPGVGSHRPLTEVQKREAAVLRVLGSCWPCVIKREKCSPGEICDRCHKTTESKENSIGCIRTHLSKDLISSFWGDDWFPKITVYMLQEVSRWEKLDTKACLTVGEWIWMKIFTASMVPFCRDQLPSSFSLTPAQGLESLSR